VEAALRWPLKEVVAQKMLHWQYFASRQLAREEAQFDSSVLIQVVLIFLREVVYVLWLSLKCHHEHSSAVVAPCAAAVVSC